MQSFVLEASTRFWFAALGTDGARHATLVSVRLPTSFTHLAQIPRKCVVRADSDVRNDEAHANTERVEHAPGPDHTEDEWLIRTQNVGQSSAPPIWTLTSAPGPVKGSRALAIPSE